MASGIVSALFYSILIVAASTQLPGWIIQSFVVDAICNDVSEYKLGKWVHVALHWYKIP